MLALLVCRGKKAAEERLAGREKRVASLEADMAALRAEAGSLRDERTSLKRELSSLDATNGNLLAVGDPWRLPAVAGRGLGQGCLEKLCQSCHILAVYTIIPRATSNQISSGVRGIPQL